MAAMSTSEEREAQYLQVYEAIGAVAARCDGAISLDEKGFDGVDTHFGRRIAAVPFEAWTDDVKLEAAKVILKYKQQVQSYIGIDVWDLEVVKEAQGRGTNYRARDDARSYARRAKNADKVAARKIDVVPSRGDPLLGIFYDRQDPDFGALLEVCKSLPGRVFDWERKCNLVPPSEAVEDFILFWDFPVTDVALALLQQPRPEFFNITLHESGDKVIIDTPYDPKLVDAIKQLPGRVYIGSGVNHADVNPMVDLLAIEFGLKIHPDARAACMKAGEALQAREAALLDARDRATLMVHLSRLRRPEDVPEALIDLLGDQS